MKRWVAALVAVLFLSTATLHVFAHHGDVDDGCAVCHMQASSLPSVAAPAVVVVQTIEFVPLPPAAPFARGERVAAVPARAPPVLPA